MVTFIVSEYPLDWKVTRLSEIEGLQTITTANSENQAREIAHDCAAKEFPSSVMRVPLNGENALLEAFLGDGCYMS